MNVSRTIVSTEDIENGSVTPAKRSALGQQISSSSGNFTDNSGSSVDVTNLSVGITTTGRPVVLQLIPDGTTDGYVGIDSTSGTDFNLFFYRDVTQIASFRGISLSGTGSIYDAPGKYFHLDVVASGTYTYKVKVIRNSAGATVKVHYCQLIAYEL